MLEYLKLNIGSYFGGNVDVTVTIKDNIVTANVESILHPDYPREHSLSKKASNEWLSKLDTLKIGSWRSRYEDDMDITDGEGWSIDYKQVGKRCRHISGYMAYPSCWAEFLDVMALVSPVHTFNRFDRVELYYHNIDEIDISESVNLPFNQVKLETTDSIVIDRKSQKITLYDTLGTGCKITREYYVEDGVPELLDECEEWFGELENVNTSSDELPQYELKIINHRGEVVCTNGGFNRRELPDCYGEFAERIAEFISFYGVYGSLLNPNNYNKGRKGEEYIFCSVSFSTGGKTYYYRTEDESISIGDRVIVPVGADDAEKTVTVENIEYFTEDDVPFPINKIKSIIGVVQNEDKNQVAPPFFQKNDAVFCPVLQRDCVDVECLEICAVSDQEIIPSALNWINNNTFAWNESMRATCSECQYNQSNFYNKAYQNALETPFGKIIIMVNGKAIEYKAQLFQFEHSVLDNASLAGCYQIQLPAKTSKSIRCILLPNQSGIEESSAPGEEMQSVLFEKENIALTIAVWDKNDETASVIEHGVESYFEKDEIPIIKLAWVTDYAGNDDCRTWYAADPLR